MAARQQALVVEALRGADVAGCRVLEVAASARPQLESLLLAIQGHAQGSNRATLGGGVGTVVGTLALGASAFAAGPALIVGGAVAYGAGGLAMLGARLGDNVRKPCFQREVKRLCEEVDVAVRDYVEQLMVVMGECLKLRDGSPGLEMTACGLKNAASLTGVGTQLFGSAGTETPLAVTDVTVGRRGLVGAAGGGVRVEVSGLEACARESHPLRAASTALATLGEVEQVVAAELQRCRHTQGSL